MVAEHVALAAVLIAALAEGLHAWRCRRVARLAFGPAAKPREWTRLSPDLRVAGVGALTWGLIVLFQVEPLPTQAIPVPEAGERHVVIVLDVSPSMQIRDAGPEGKISRAHRASEVLRSLLDRIALDQTRVSVVAFYTSARPVVVDTWDMNVINNILDDLPLEYAFPPGKTKILDGLREAAVMAKGWKPGSATLVLASDGDSVPDTGMPEMPAAVAQTIVIGVGNPSAGRFIDGHVSRQDASALRQIATRLKGVYHDGNQKHLPSTVLTELATVLPLKDEVSKERQTLALWAVGFGAALLAGLPVALALAGSGWHAARRRIANEQNGSPAARPFF